MEILFALLLIIGGVVLIIKYKKPSPPFPPEPPNPPPDPEPVVEKKDYVTIYKFSQNGNKVRCATCDAENATSSLYCYVCGSRVKG